MKLVSLETWGGHRRDRPSMSLPVLQVYVHHTVTPDPLNEDAEVQQLQQIDADHRSRGWGGIGYSFIIGPSGTVYEGQGQTIGAHTAGQNSKSFGVAFLGNFMRKIPTSAAVQAFRELCWHLLNVGALTDPFELDGHQDAPDADTLCPGDKLQDQLPELRRLVAARPKEGPVPDPNRTQVNAPVVGAIAAHDNHGNVKGYALIGADGGVFIFGDGIPFLGNVEFSLPFGASWVPSSE